MLCPNPEEMAQLKREEKRGPRTETIGTRAMMGNKNAPTSFCTLLAKAPFRQDSRRMSRCLCANMSDWPWISWVALSWHDPVAASARRFPVIARCLSPPTKCCIATALHHIGNTRLETKPVALGRDHCLLAHVWKVSNLFDSTTLRSESLQRLRSSDTHLLRIYNQVAVFILFSCIGPRLSTCRIYCWKPQLRYSPIR